MSFLFLVRDGKLPAREVTRRRAVARAHDCEFVHAKLPEGWRSWFIGPNQGDPFDRHLREAVLADLQQGGDHE